MNLERVIEEFWLDNYVHPDLRLCSLCGNTGKIDTRGRAVSAAGVDAGRENFCICPNGLQERRRCVNRVENLQR